MTHNIDGAKLTPKVINELIELQTKGSALIYREQIENIIDFLLECHILDDSHPAMILDFIINLREIESSLYNMLPEEDVTIVTKRRREMKLIYSINADMSGALCVAKEIVSITGMTPELIEVDESTKVKYNKIDSFKVEKGEMGIEDYINRNKIIDK